MSLQLIVAMTGASGAYAAELLLKKSPWPTVLIASKWGRQIYAHECGPVGQLEKAAEQVLDNADMLAPPASGSVPTVGMVILPCSTTCMRFCKILMNYNRRRRRTCCPRNRMKW